MDNLFVFCMDNLSLYQDEMLKLFHSNTKMICKTNFTKFAWLFQEDACCLRI